MTRIKDIPVAITDFIRNVFTPYRFFMDNHQAQNSECVTAIIRAHGIADYKNSEPHLQFQNPTEEHA